MYYTQWEAQQMQFVYLENNNQMSANAQCQTGQSSASFSYRSSSYSNSSCSSITLCHTCVNGRRKWGAPPKWRLGQWQWQLFSDCCCMTLESEICFAARRALIIIIIFCFCSARIGQCGGKITRRHAMSNGCSPPSLKLHSGRDGSGGVAFFCAHNAHAYLLSRRAFVFIVHTN